MDKSRCIPVVVIKEIEQTKPILSALQNYGINCAEITFRTQAAESIIKAASKEFPEMYLGAGTILNVKDLHRAFDAGAKFAVAPGFNPTVVREAQRYSYDFAPGICTPSEIEQAYEEGCRFFKFFPAEAAGGVKMLKAIAAPYKHLGIKFMPTGGVNEKNMLDYLAFDRIICCGGTFMCPKDLIKNKEWDKITELCIGARKAAKGE